MPISECAWQWLRTRRGQCYERPRNVEVVAQAVTSAAVYVVSFALSVTHTPKHPTSPSHQQGTNAQFAHDSVVLSPQQQALCEVALVCNLNRELLAGSVQIRHFVQCVTQIRQLRRKRRLRRHRLLHNPRMSTPNET